MTPCRIQLRRAKGWRVPPNTVKVSRPGWWGNPFVVGAMWDRRRMEPGGGVKCCGPVTDNADAVRLFLRFTAREVVYQLAAHEHLHGKNLACWCKLCPEHRDGLPLGVTCDACAPCHADVLLACANTDAPEARNE